MTKAEELKLLEQIETLILSAGDSYIKDTFDGVVDVCRQNIIDDAYNRPVKDLDQLREKCYAENKAHGEILLKLEHERDAMAETISAKNAEIEKLGHLLDSKTAECERIKEARDCMADCVEGNAEILADAESEIRKLKAEIVRMRMQNMTEEEVAKLYDKTEGA